MLNLLLKLCSIRLSVVHGGAWQVMSKWNCGQRQQSGGRHLAKVQVCHFDVGTAKTEPVFPDVKTFSVFPWPCHQAPSSDHRTIQLYSHDMFEPKESIAVRRRASQYWLLSCRMCLAELWFLLICSFVRLEAGSCRWLEFSVLEYSQLNQDACHLYQAQCSVRLCTSRESLASHLINSRTIKHAIDRNHNRAFWYFHFTTVKVTH